MSLTASLNNAIGGLDLAARRADLIATNIARADDPTYAQRRLETDGTAPGTSVRRMVDPAAQQMRREAEAEAANAEIGRGFAAELDRLIGDPDQPGSLQDSLARVVATLTVAAADPTSEAALSAVSGALDDVATRLRTMADAVTNARREAEDAIAEGVDRLNADLTAVEELNARILRAEALGQDSAALRDARAMRIDSIAEAVPVRRLDRGDGTMGLVTLGGAILLDGRAATVGFSPRQYITPDQTFPATLGELTLRDRPAGTGRDGELFAGGALAAQFAIRDEAGPTAMARLDAFAQDLATRLQEADASLAAGDPGPLSDAGAAVGAAPIAGLAGRLTLNPAYVADGARRLRDGATGPEDPSANDQLLAFSAALDARRAPPSDALGTGATDIGGLGARLRSALSSDRVAADRRTDGFRREADRLAAARDGGAISIDEEMQRLLRVEQSYAANARLIQAVGQMMDRLTEI